MNASCDTTTARPPAGPPAPPEPSANALPEPRLAFVLSAGRTGTVFLTKALNAGLPGVRCEHEPSPARREIMLGNFRNWSGLGGTMLRRLVHRARNWRLSKLAPGEVSVELNPMLCPLTDLLPELTDRLCVTHIVRDPRTWTTSILNFRASGFRRHLIERTPFANPYPVPRPVGWLTMSRTVRALWRWRFCNEQILALRSRCHSFRIVRHEDLLGTDRTRQEAAIASLLQGLDLPVPEDLSWFATGRPENASPTVRRPAGPPPEDLVQQICGPLLAEFGYQRSA